MQMHSDTALSDADALRTLGVLARVTYPVFRRAAAQSAPGPIRSGVQLCTGISVFHDAGDATVTLGATTNGPAFDIADEAITYLSVSAELPETACAEIGPGRFLDVDIDAVADRAVPVYLRLNLSTQPEPVVLHDLIIASDVPRRVTFNFDAVAYPLDDARDGAWVDVIFSKPGGRRIALRDLGLAIRIQGWPEQPATP